MANSQSQKIRCQILLNRLAVCFIQLPESGSSTVPIHLIRPQNLQFCCLFGP
jgi:hypothetical protein